MSRNPWMFLNLKDQQLSNEQSKQVCVIIQIHEWLAHEKTKISAPSSRTRWLWPYFTRPPFLQLNVLQTFIESLHSSHDSSHAFSFSYRKDQASQNCVNERSILSAVIQFGKLGENITTHIFKWKNDYHPCINQIFPRI